MRKISLSLYFVASLMFLFVVSSASTDESHGDTSSGNQNQRAVHNWFDLATWGSNGKTFSQPGMLMPFNPAHPASWAKIISPKTHVDWHMAFTNPANYTQFMQPQFYMQFLNPNTWMAWMNPANYVTFMDPATYMWWMTPTAYVHGMDLNNYMQMANPANYTVFMNPMTYMQQMNPATYTLPTGAESLTQSFDWDDWFKMFDPNTYALQQRGEQADNSQADSQTQ